MFSDSFSDPLVDLFPINKFKSFIISRECRISPALMCSKICPFRACFTELSVVLFELDNVEGKKSHLSAYFYEPHTSRQAINAIKFYPIGVSLLQKKK